MATVVNKADTVSRPVPEPPKPIDGRHCGLHDEWESGWFRKDRGELAPGFPISAEDVLLDVGCGDGAASTFAAARGAKVFAADVDPKAIESVKDKFTKGGFQHCQALLSDSNPLPLDDELVSRVVAMEVMEHVPDPTRFLAELVRVGQPGALYLIAVPDASSESLQKVLAPPSYWQPPNHLHIFQREQLDRLVESAGLTIELKTYKSFFWALWWVLFWASDQDFNDPEGPILSHWTQTWHALMQSPKGLRTRQALNEFMPKSQVIVARKAA